MFADSCAELTFATNVLGGENLKGVFGTEILIVVGPLISKSISLDQIYAYNFWGRFFNVI